MSEAISSNTDAIYAEYPFLDKLSPRSKTTNAKITRWDEEFILFTPKQHAYLRMFLLDTHGRIVTEVGGLFRRGESLNQAMYRLKDNLRHVKYALTQQSHGSGRQPPYRIVFYKLPREFENAGAYMADYLLQERGKIRGS